MSRDWHEGYDFCDGSNHGDQGSDNGKQGNLINIRSETEKDEGWDLKKIIVVWCLFSIAFFALYRTFAFYLEKLVK